MAERADLVRLRQELARDLSAADILLRDVRAHTAALAGPTSDRVVLGYVAVTLHQFYTAIETLFERIARTLEGSLPKGADAHHALLGDMTLELPGIRPAVLDEHTADRLRPLMRFRHFVRHSYAVAWDAERLGEVLRDAERAWPDVQRDIGEFVAFLDGALSTLGNP